MSDLKKSTCIDCHFHTKERRDFYIDESQTVWPCCHYANNKDNLEFYDRKLYQSLKDNPDWNKITKNDIENILSNEIYAHDIYYPGWESDNPPKACQQFCGGGEFRKIDSNNMKAGKQQLF